ncbi:ATP-binding protein [Kocuria carniphila]|uniref:ATP-binding protein n=1 Tax=Kocuria carniphila TaxID=262208 RepID=UPI00101DC2C9|nr:ATP-binding protein [Kocuria carniphila]
MSARLRINALRLTATTAEGEVGRELRFVDGLNLLRADNSSGKSTALQGIIYALGLEGMLGPSQRIPLPHAMTDNVTVRGVDGRIVDSCVELEIVNGDGKQVTVIRPIVSASKDKHLVTVSDGPKITVPDDYLETDYFVRRTGAAQNLAGFHRYLAHFLGIQLPQVSRMDGSEAPLYLETIFPYFFVEQKHGWSGIQARIPTYLGIRDVGKRSAEFVLGLEAFDRVLRRQRIRSNLSEIEAEWQATNKQLSEVAKLSRVVIQNPPRRIQHGIPDGTFVPTVSIDDEWLPLREALQRMHRKLIDLDGTVPSAEQAADGLEQDVRRLDASLRQSLAVASGLAEEKSELDSRYTQVLVRLEALREDLQRHKDSQVLESYGSEHAHSLIADHVCPTCHQELEDGADISPHAMTIAENIDFIQRQIATFEGTRADIERVTEAIAVRQGSLASQIHEYRSEIRAARETLSSAKSTPSVADISRRLTQEARLAELSARDDEFAAVRLSMLKLAQSWSEQRILLNSLTEDELSGSDKEKLGNLESSLRTQLRSYGFDSLDPDEIYINRSTYRPIHEGFDLGFDLSASDMIRVIWAYLFGMLDVGREGAGNHLGLLIFDEPRQQETARTSYQALLANASTSGLGGAQIIFATSEPSQSLLSMLQDREFNLIDLKPGEKLLQSR